MEGTIDKLNWPDQYPEKPEVKFSLKAEGAVLKLKFSVREEKTIARASHNFDEVWKDSCCELFIQFEGEDKYYNLETSCNGYQLFAYRAGRFDPENACEEVMDKIVCRTSLKKHAKMEPTHIDEWTLDIEIPADAFWKSGFKDFFGVKAKGNIYKCVQCTERMHFLSWAPVSSPSPDFHRPEYFKPLNL